MPLLVVGSAAFAARESPYGKVDRAVGGAATYFAVAASFFTHVNLAGIVGDDCTDVDAQIFHGRTINLGALERAAGQTIFWAVPYSQDGAEHPGGEARRVWGDDGGPSRSVLRPRVSSRRAA